MKTAAILKYEWIHFVRNPFKLIAIALFVIAAAYGIYNGSKLYHTQTKEIDRISAKQSEDQEETLSFFDNNQKGPEDRPWVDITTPFWASWYASGYSFKNPSPLMVYGVGQAEQYGYYKRVTFWSSPYDADMAEEIANPERLQTGQLDYTFTILYLMPLLLLICLYNIKGTEYDRGILSLVSVQAKTTTRWLWIRILFYTVVLLLVNLLLLLIAGLMTSVFSEALNGFWSMVFWSSLYLIFWVICYGLIIQFSKSSIENTFKMVGLWLLVAFVIPGIVHQWISTSNPTNLMTDFIDSQRDERNAIYELPDSIYQKQLDALFPEIKNAVVYNDSEKAFSARRYSASALANDLTKQSIVGIEDSFRTKNQAIQRSFWYNPTSFFQNRFNKITKTHFDDYQEFRTSIQNRIDGQIKIMVVNLWNEKIVDRETYLNLVKEINDL